MRTLKIKIYVTLFIVLFLWLVGCSHTTKSDTDLSKPLNRPVADDEYSQQIVKLNQLVAQNSKSSGIKQAHLKLARLYSDHNNPKRNYHKAFAHLQTYVRLEKSKVNGDTLYWLASLKEINRLAKEISAQNKQLKRSKKEKSALTRTNRKLRREEIILREKARKLQESNQKLQKTIERLKSLDQRLEEKRRNFSR